MYTPSEADFDRVLERFREAFPRGKFPPGFHNNKLSVTGELVISYMEEINRASSPGLPWARLGSTKGKILDNHRGLIVEAVLDRLQVLSGPSLKTKSPTELVSDFAVDPVRLFIKNEPHLLSKLEENRYRLVSNCSIVDELVTRILFSNQVNAEIDNWITCPAKPGAGLILEEQQLALWHSVFPWITKAVSTDVSGWDWGVFEWMLLLNLRIHLSMLRVDENHIYSRICYNWLWSYMSTLFVTSDGKMFITPIRGIVKTGSFVTASHNSRMRAQVGYLIGVKNIITMGDDATEEEVEGLMNLYQNLGLKVKEVVKFDGRSFSFCSHMFRGGKAVPENHVKMFFNLLMTPKSAISLEQFKLELRSSPMLPKLLAIYETVA